MLFIYAFVILTLGLTTAAQAQQRSPIDRLRHANPHRTNENAISSPRGKRDLPKRQHSRFLNNNTRKFVVNGSALPEVDFDVGESYAGLLPIGEASDESRQLWFWFFPSTNPAANNEITVWLNGGPGCSSMTGLITENGPFLWVSACIPFRGQIRLLEDVWSQALSSRLCPSRPQNRKCEQLLLSAATSHLP